LIANNPTIKTINLKVVDNAFNAQKARLIYGYLSSSQVSVFHFQNIASSVNYKDSEYSDFIENMKPIKSLPITGVIKWCQKIVEWG